MRDGDRSIIRKFDSPNVSRYFLIHFYRHWLNLHIFSQLGLVLGLGLELELVKMHVAAYTFGLSDLSIMET